VHGRGAGAGADGVADGDAPGPIVDADLYFDELMRRQRAIHFGKQRVGHARVAGVDHRLERVRPSFQVRAFPRGQGIRHGAF
jgi:hypothetical protein